MNDLQFDENMSKYDFEKLKLLYFNLLHKMQENGSPLNPGMDEPGQIINVEYCPNCKDKMKHKSIPIEEGELLCKYCDNAKICKLTEVMKKMQNYLLELNFICKYFIPNVDEE